jgi:hypothetical protein
MGNPATSLANSKELKNVSLLLLHGLGIRPGYDTNRQSSILIDICFLADVLGKPLSGPKASRAHKSPSGTFGHV